MTHRNLPHVHANRIISFTKYILIAVLFSSCASYKVTRNWVDWNILFKPGTDEAQKNLVINNLQSYLQDTLAKSVAKDLGVKVVIDSPKTIFCPCDSLLYNLRADLLIDTSGGSVSNPPPPPPPKAQGGPVDVLSKNDSLARPDIPKYQVLKGLVQVSGRFIKEGPLVTVIDTGIDSSLFTPSLKEALINSPQTLNNFVIGATGNSNYDDDAWKHGSTVSAIALDAFKGKTYPRFLVLKALDEHGVGSIYSVSCALSYATQRNSSLINASWGYYGKPDSVLLHYVTEAEHTQSIIVAAAGNDTTQPTGNLVCSPDINTRNQLSPSHLFFPACFNNADRKWFITVTGLSNTDKPCYYQNFSSTYVTVGVANNNTTLPGSNIEKSCCSYRLPYMQTGKAAEGSSFATPIITGKIGNAMVEGARGDVNFYLHSIGVTQNIQLIQFTMRGQILPF